MRKIDTNYIVFDLEATCWEQNNNFKNSEIIEIGAVKYKIKDGVLIAVEKFQRFVKPIKNPVLSDFCKKLTSIKQEDVDSADTFDVVMKEFGGFIGIGFCLISWGNYDKIRIKADCEDHGIQLNRFNHINLKQEFSRITNTKPCGMTKALKRLNIPLEGTHHRGIDDAINTGKIFETIINDLDLEGGFKN